MIYNIVGAAGFDNFASVQGPKKTDLSIAASSAAVPGMPGADGNVTAAKSESAGAQKGDADEKKQSSWQAETQNTWVSFKVHKATGTTMIQVLDSSGNIIREIPPEKLLDSVAEIWKSAGINLNKKI